MFKKLIIFLLSLMCSLFFIPSVQASCLEVDQAATVNFNNTSPIIVPQGVAVGTVIYTAHVHAEYKLSQPASCSGYDSENDLKQGGATKVEDEHYSTVFSTNIDGIGYTFYVPGAGRWDNKKWGTIDPVYYFVPGSDDYTLSFIATSTVIGKGTITSGLYGERRLGDHASGTLETLANIYINGGNIVSVCDVKDANISVPMGTISDSDFTGPGSNSAEVKFKVAVNCPANSNVYVTMGGTADSDMTDGSVLALTPGEGNATGIGAQILYDSTPLKLNEKLFMEKTAGGDESLQFSARYIQTKPSITPGHANATGTLTITYE